MEDNPIDKASDTTTDTLVYIDRGNPDTPQRGEYGLFAPGNTVGKAGVRKDYIAISAHIKRLCSERGIDGRTKGELIAEKLLKMAGEGDRQAMDMVLDRLEGKAVTPIGVAGVTEETNALLKELAENRRNGEASYVCEDGS
jgi:hypothetical protein